MNEDPTRFQLVFQATRARTEQQREYRIRKIMKKMCDTP